MAINLLMNSVGVWQEETQPLISNSIVSVGIKCASAVASPLTLLGLTVLSLSPDALGPLFPC